MQILLFLTLLALAAANVIQEDESKNREDQKPGMCFEDYMRSHPGALEKFMKKKSDGSCGHGGPQKGQQQQKKDWHQSKSQDGSQHHEHKKHEMDFSKLKSCSVDNECDGAEKCCRTMCGMRCTRPFEPNKMGGHGDHAPAPSNNEQDAEAVEQKQREKRHARSESSESSE